VESTSSFLRRWLPAAAWAVLIFSASTGTFKSDNTSRFILPFLRWLLPHAQMPTLEFLHVFIRKSAHFAEYFIFSVLLFRAVRGPQRGWQLRWALLAVAIVAAYSASDEFHQWFVPGRQASPWDSLLDTFGAVIAQIAAWVWH
jgi:VanZ family protein